MAVNRIYQTVGYGLTDALTDVFQPPIVSTRNPTSADKAQLGTIWVNKSTSTFFVQTNVANNAATWVQPENSGGAGVFSSVEVTTGNLTVDTGNVTITQGTLHVVAGTTTLYGTTTIVDGNLTVSAGVIDAVAGDISALGGIITGGTLSSAGDLGGTTSQTSFTNAINTTQGVGALTVLSTTGSDGINTGFIKIYVGTTVAYVPYFTNIAPS